jgi:hypothetical protein
MKINRNQLSDVYVGRSGAVYLPWEDVKVADDMDEMGASLTEMHELAGSKIPHRGRSWYADGIFHPHRAIFSGAAFDRAKLIEIEVKDHE